MAEWLYEAGIGEARAALIEGGRIVEMQIEPDDRPGPFAGAILTARLARKADASGRGLATLDDGTSVQLVPVPPALTEGAALLIEIIREPQPEGRETKPARARPVTAPMAPRPASDLLARITASGVVVRRLGAIDDDRLEQLGWSDALEEAASGIVARPSALLRIALTPAMTLIDVDGSDTAAEVALAGARLAGETIRRFGIAGSIGIDLPTLAAKAERQAAADAIDAILPQPFERTAVNGFGFLQIVRRRVRPSLMEQLAADPLRAAATALLRRAERSRGHGEIILSVHPALAARIAARPDWTDALAARLGAPVRLREAPALAISAGDVSRTHA